MDIDLKTALSERLGRIRALTRSLYSDEHDAKDIAHLQQLIDIEVNGALQDLEVSDA